MVPQPQQRGELQVAFFFLFNIYVNYFLSLQSEANVLYPKSVDKISRTTALDPPKRYLHISCCAPA